jgi:hypothetical protein
VVEILPAAKQDYFQQINRNHAKTCDYLLFLFIYTKHYCIKIYQKVMNLSTYWMNSPSIMPLIKGC